MMKKTFTITIDHINGEVDYDNVDDLSFFEVLGAIEYLKMMIHKQWLTDLGKIEED